MLNPTPRHPSSAYQPSTSPQSSPSPRCSSAFDDEDFCDIDVPSSRSVSPAIELTPCSSPRRHAMANQPPSLKDILLDTAPPPWSLSAFMAYLSQNHCMETLEFTLDSQRYAAYYDQLGAEQPPSREKSERVCGWWEKLMQVYIVPCAPREVNIPSPVRDRLLGIPYALSPPHPSELEDAGRIIYELMNDSLLVPFLQAVGPQQLAVSDEQARLLHRRSRSSGGRDHGRRHVPTQSLPSSHPIDIEGLTDDSDGNSPPLLEPMTPPTTPPTSDYAFHSPGGFHRAVAAHSKGWKKVGAKLGFTRKSSSRRSTPTSSSTDYDPSFPETSHSSSNAS
ncbi:hypothetical protein RJ55_07116 [Drechmeria coniospora]|nr:hypothetical protein RJ55_07116 [Drechmeria coniospora]